MPTVANPKLKAVSVVQEAVTEELMATDDILGTAIALDHQGDLALVVYVNLESKNMAQLWRECLSAWGTCPWTLRQPAFSPLLRFKPIDSGTTHRVMQTCPHPARHLRGLAV